MERIENIEEVIKECLQNHDALLSHGEDIVNTYKAQSEETDTLKSEVEELKAKNDELRRECQKWMLRSNAFGENGRNEEQLEDYETISKRLKAKLKG